MNILRKAFKIFNGSSWDEYHLKTDSKQVVHTKADGTDTTVEEQLLALNSTSGIYRKRFDYSGKIPNNSVVWVTLAEKGTYDGYTMIGAIVDWPTYPVFVSAPQHSGDGRIFTRIWNYSNEQNTIACIFYIYFVKNGAIKGF